ncbi:hypothetical protein ETAE_3356 [Edwardsiella piscicida]|uniref:Uncharacterized protein n=1 Tax=Edwardsiella piscicida TaxID=1263550 RepID=A0AAU8PD19_EDWPI|nr:hypothetical protein ETAE_3356 [Edwardsiella tarda EIB202]
MSINDCRNFITFKVLNIMFIGSFYYLFISIRLSSGTQKVCIGWAIIGEYLYL